MASNLVITHFPDIIVADSPSEIHIVKRGIVSTPGGYARLFLVLDETDPPILSETLILKRNGAAYLTFTFNGNPGNTDMPIYTAGPFDDYAQELAYDLARNPTLKNDYKVALLSYDAVSQKAIIVFTSRVRGLEGNLTIDAATTLGYVVANSVVESVVDDVVLANYKVKLAVDIQRDVLFNTELERVDDIEATGVVNYETDVMKITVHELPPLTKSNMRYDVPENANTIQPYRESQVTVIVEVHEDYTGADKKSINQLSGDIRSGASETLAIIAGLPLRKVDFDGFFFTETLFRYFNMWPERSKVTSKQQAEWLTALHAVGTTTVTYTVYYSNGTSQTKDVVYANELAHLIFIPAGFDQNLLAELNPGSLTEIRWTVTSVNSSLPDYEVYEYIIDQRYFKEERCLLFANSLGRFETLRLVGVHEFSIKNKIETTTRARVMDTETARGTIEMVYNEFEEMWTLRTGWLLSKDEKEYMIDFLSSKYIAEITIPMYEPEDYIVAEVVTGITYFKQRIRALVIVPETYKLWDTEDGKYALEFKMKYAHDEINYSNIALLKETHYDTVVEFWAEVTDITGGSPYIQIGVDTDHPFKVEYLGAELDWTVPQHVITNEKNYFFKVSTSGGSGAITILANDVTANVRIEKIESNHLREMSLIGFDNIVGEYLIRKLRYWWKLDTLAITTGSDPGLEFNQMMESLIELNRYVPGVLTDLLFLNTTPDAAGYLMKDYLIANGVNVTTL